MSHPRERAAPWTIPAGLAVASFVPPAVMAGFEVISSGGLSRLSGVLFLFLLPFSIMAAVVLGFPLLVAAIVLGKVRWWTCTAGGALVGIAVIVLISGINWNPVGFSSFSAIGALSGAAFWMVWRGGRVR